MTRRFSKDRDFLALWAATTVSQFGTMLGALSLTALLYLKAYLVERRGYESRPHFKCSLPNIINDPPAPKRVQHR